jgi:hypothetical protein
MSKYREIKKYIQSDQPAWKPGGASATPKPRKNPVTDCAVALYTMQSALLVISNLTWQDLTWLLKYSMTINSCQSTWLSWCHNRKREKKCVQSDQPAWNPGGASATPQSRKILFLTVLSLFAQCKMHYWWLITWLDLVPQQLLDGAVRVIASKKGMNAASCSCFA